MRGRRSRLALAVSAACALIVAGNAAGVVPLPETTREGPVAVGTGSYVPEPCAVTVLLWGEVPADRPPGSFSVATRPLLFGDPSDWCTESAGTRVHASIHLDLSDVSWDCRGCFRQIVAGAWSTGQVGGAFTDDAAHLVVRGTGYVDTAEGYCVDGRCFVGAWIELSSGTVEVWDRAPPRACPDALGCVTA